ncbi:MAG TPA: serine/threonine-protein kinase [Polyangiaceae bacterium]|nr:serine/threonine-protein kinase [Polyangiaceae bacterium]
MAHSRGIAHRDLKPDNVFLVREGDVEIVKVLDFGIAKRLDVQTYSGAAKTRTGTLLGTPYYMSPEQAHGKTLVDHRTDVWSFGVIGYECITGRRPFDEQTLAALLLAICSEAPPTPSSVALVPKGFDEWFSRATARELDRRFSSAAEAAQALAALGTATSEGPTASLTKSSSLFTKTVEATTTPLVETVKPSSVTSSGAPVKGKPFSKRVLLVALPAVAALGGMAWWLSSKPSAPESAVSTPSVLAATPAPYAENDLKTGPVTTPSAYASRHPRFHPRARRKPPPRPWLYLPRLPPRVRQRVLRSLPHCRQLRQWT